MEAEAALVQIRALANSFLTPELRHQLKLPAGSADPGGNNRQPDDLAHENQQLRQQLAELVEENALGKRRRLVGEVNVVEGGSSAGRSLTSWGQGGERRRAAEEVEASRVVHAREREAWQKERAQLEASRDTFARDLKFVALRLESREHELTEAKAEHQHRVKSLETQLREAQREGFAGAQQHIAEEASAGSLARQVEKLTSDKASLERALASLEASTQSALAKASATHADELAAERALREEQAQNQATAREFKAEAATKAAELKVAQLQKELAAEQHRAQALAQQVANAPAVPSKALEETNDALTAQVASLRAELVEEQSKAATATNERDLLNDQSQAWVALFNQEGGNLLAPNEELTGNGAHAKADPASSLSRHKTSKATPSASSLPQRVFEALRVARANELAYRSLHAKSEDKRREQTLQLETASQEVAEWKATAARVERVKSGLEADLATSRHLLGVKDQALTRRNELLASYAHNEAKPGRRSDDQKFEKERLLESEVASLQKALRNHEEAMARASGGGGGGGGGGGQPQNPHVEAAEAAVASLEAQLKAALAEKTETERNLERCEETLRVANSTGQVVSQQAKVLHMVANPSAAAAAQRRQAEAARVSGLEEENERLKVALAAAQQGGGGCAPSPGGALGLGLASGVAGAATPNSSTNAASPELVNQRLKDMFRRNVEQFKHAVQALFGYELIFTPGTSSYTVKVRSIYAEREADFLQFEWATGDEAGGEGGKVDLNSPLQLMGTPFAQQLQRAKPQMLKVYLGTYNSIPMFLGEVTRHLFESTTQFGTM